MENKSKGKILVVDDEKNLRDLCEIVLTKHGYEVIIAGNGVEALKIYKKQGKGIDVILSDIQMPKMNGIKFFRELKKIDSKTPLYFCTTLYDDEETQDLLNQGVAGFIEKPYEINTLKAVVDSAIAKYKKTPINQTE